MLQLENINLQFDKPILKKVNLKLLPGELVGLVGKSGAGKSSLLKILAGYIQPNEGRIIFDKTELPHSNSLLIPGFNKIALVNQDFKLDPFHTVEENIRESILHLPNHKREIRVKKLLRLFELFKIANHKANQVSGGEQQRVALARAIAKKPAFLLLDEPFGHLDTNLRNKLKQYLLNIREEENTGILLVSHDEQDILGLCDSVCILKNGRLGKKQSPEVHYYDLSNCAQASIFGLVNSISFNGQTLLFRPDEYKINLEKGIKVRYVRSIFGGAFYENIFFTEKNERIVLYNQKKMEKVNFIDVDRKQFN